MNSRFTEVSISFGKKRKAEWTRRGRRRSEHSEKNSGKK